MDTNTCKNYELCPIFNGALKDLKTTSESYKRQFCNAGAAGWNNCKRYVIKEKTGKCPPNLLPNSLKSIEQIMQTMN